MTQQTTRTKFLNIAYLKHAMQVILLILATMLISSCSKPPSPICMAPGDSGNEVEKEIKVDPKFTANGGWVYSGIKVPENAFLRIQTSGIINLCTDAKSHPFTPKSNQFGWQTEGSDKFTVDAYDLITVKITGKFSRWSPTPDYNSAGVLIGNSTKCPAPGNPSLWDSDCYSKSGKGLYMYISNDYPTNDSNLDPSTAANPKFMELHNYATGTVGYTGFAPAAGKLYFHYDEGHNGYIADKTFADYSGIYNDNQGDYTVTLQKQCSGLRGKYMVAGIGDGSGSFTQINLTEYANPEKVGIYYSDPTPAGGFLYFKINDTVDDDYTNNSGYYKVNIRTIKSEVNASYSKLIKQLTDPIYQVLFVGDGEDTMSITQKTFIKLLPPDNAANKGTLVFVNIVRACLLLFIVIYVVSFLMGMVKEPRTDFVVRVVKFAIVAQLISPDSWEFFNEYFFKFFIEGYHQILTAITDSFTTYITGGAITDATNPAGSTSASAVGSGITDLIQGTADKIGLTQDKLTFLSNYVESQIDLPNANDLKDQNFGPNAQFLLSDPFKFINLTLTEFLSYNTLAKITSLAFTNITGPIIAGIFLFGMIFFMYLIAKTVIVYLIAMVVMSFLIGLAPIFILALLFEETKPVFETWYKMLLNYTIQPILLFTVMSIFNVFVYASMFYLLNFEACWECKLYIEFLTFIPGIEPNDVCLLGFYVPSGTEKSAGEFIVDYLTQGTVVGFFKVIIFVLMVHMFAKFTQWALDIGAELTNGVKALSLNTAAGLFAEKALSPVKAGAKVAEKGAKLAITAGVAVGRAVITGGGDTGGALIDAGKEIAKETVETAAELGAEAVKAGVDSINEK